MILRYLYKTINKYSEIINYAMHDHIHAKLCKYNCI